MPTLDEAQDALGYSPEQMKRIISYLRERKGVAIVTGGFLLFPEIEAAFMDKISSIEGDITLAAVRDATGSSRKYALPAARILRQQGRDAEGRRQADTDEKITSCGTRHKTTSGSK